ncbi:MAG: DUF4214 domain-containing protein [Burkholderiaceae bacterium]|nr:MAG: DUF4214 domain-containing protein [Burkholderiaceae bacterium]
MPQLPESRPNSTNFTNLKKGLTLNYARVGYYNDATSSDVSNEKLFELLNRLKAEGYTGVIFELTVGVDRKGNLTNQETYDRLYQMLDYSESIGLGTAILPNWNLNDDNVGYIGNGSPLPSEFSVANFQESVRKFYAVNAPKLENHGLDLLYIANDSQDFFTSQYAATWKSIISEIRTSFSGAISYSVTTPNKYNSERISDKISIWDYLDAVTIWNRTFISNTPIYDTETIVSKYFLNNELNSFVKDIATISQKHNLPVMLIVNYMNHDTALDGGWDPTNEESTTRPLKLNPKLQAQGFAAFLQLVENNLFPFVSGIVLSSYEIWAMKSFSDPIFDAFKYFDLTLFPPEAQKVIHDYMSSNGNFKVTETTSGSRYGDVIYVKSGTNKVLLNGGNDEVHGGAGPDQFILPSLTQLQNKTLKMTIGGWFNINDKESLNFDVMINGTKIGAGIATPDAGLAAKSPNGYWANLDLNFDISKFTDITDLRVVCKTAPGLLGVSSLTINDFPIDINSGKHKSFSADWYQPAMIAAFDETYFDVQRFHDATFPNRATIDGGADIDTLRSPEKGRSFILGRDSSQNVILETKQNAGFKETVLIKNVEKIQFDDLTVDLGVKEYVKKIAAPDLQKLQELYVAFFNRVPDANGLKFWVDQVGSGASINKIADSFYQAGIAFSDLTGYSATMSDADFVNRVYKNVLGRSQGADAEGLAYWSNALATGKESRGSLVASIAYAAHTFKNDATWGWVANLLDNKIQVANKFAVDYGITFNLPNDSVSNGMSVAGLVTPNDVNAAISLIGTFIEFSPTF